jgi:hypothetical protein
MTAGQKKRLQIHPAGLLITLLSFGAWVVALGGVGGATQNCVNGGYVGTAATSSASVQCAKTYQWEWWGLWFEGCLLVALFVSAFFEAFTKGKQVFVSYFTLATMVLMWGAHNFITTSLVGTANFKAKDSQQARARTTAFAWRGFCASVRRCQWAPQRSAAPHARAPARTPCAAARRAASARFAAGRRPFAARARAPPSRMQPRTRLIRTAATAPGGQQRRRGGLHHPVHLQLCAAYHPRL